MESTTINGFGRTVWLSTDIELDLRDQGHLTGTLAICSTRVCQDTYGGVYQGNRFLVSWEHDTSLALSMEVYDQELVDAFSAVLGYPGFCKYRLQTETKICYVVEWMKKGSIERTISLKETPGVQNLEILSPTKL
jgi:hypothetical protein